MNRPRPVLIYGVVVAALQALLGVADLTNLMPGKTIATLNTLLIVLIAIGGALFTQEKVTPLSSPQANDGTPLVPKDMTGRSTSRTTTGTTSPVDVIYEREAERPEEPQPRPW